METVAEQKELFYGVRGTAVKILQRIERTDSYLDKLLDAELRTGEINDLDKSLLTEIVNGVLRWQLKLDWVLNGFFHSNFAKAEPLVRNTLRVALYQILYLHKVPQHAAVNEAVEFMKRIRGEKPANLVNGVLRNIIRSIDNIFYPDYNNDPFLYLSVAYSHPLWMVRRWVNRFGFQETEKLMFGNNRRVITPIRINTLKTSVQDVLNMFKQQNVAVEQSIYLPNFLKSYSFSNVAHTEIFKRGYCSIQDESAGIAVQLLHVQPNETVIDLCSAPGGKTTFIAENLRNTGKVIAVEKYPTRIKLVQSACERLELKNVEYVVADGTEFEHAPVDKILVDAPCSGLGVIAKKPDIKIKRQLEDIRELNTIQNQLLENASRLVKDGGVIVYSTCTTEPEENFIIIRKFLQNHSEFSIDSAAQYCHSSIVSSDGYVETFPHKHGIDGSFAIRLIKNKTN